jgi:predicted transcriptional regulator
MTITKENTQNNETNLNVEKNIDIMPAFRKFCNRDMFKIAQYLSEGYLSLNELRNKTNLSTNTLNHKLIEMRNHDLVVLSDNKYHLTMFGYVIFKAIINTKSELKKYINNNRLYKSYI